MNLDGPSNFHMVMGHKITSYFNPCDVFSRGSVAIIYLDNKISEKREISGQFYLKILDPLYCEDIQNL